MTNITERDYCWASGVSTGSLPTRRVSPPVSKTRSSFEFQVSPERPFLNYIYLLFAVLDRSCARGVLDLRWSIQDPVSWLAIESALGAQSLSPWTAKGVSRVAVSARTSAIALFVVSCLSSFLPEFSPEWSLTGLAKSYCHRMKRPENVIISRIRSSLNYKHVHKVCTKTSWLICMSPAQAKLFTS